MNTKPDNGSLLRVIERPSWKLLLQLSKTRADKWPTKAVLDEQGRDASAPEHKGQSAAKQQSIGPAIAYRGHSQKAGRKGQKNRN